MADKTVLLVWEFVPEETKLYKLTGHAAELALKSAGKFINCTDLAEDDPIHELSEMLPTLETFDIEAPVDGPFDAAVVCGFIM